MKKIKWFTEGKKQASEMCEALAPLNCFYNKEPNKNGLCYSTECMFNTDPVIRKRIKKKGCRLYKKVVKEKLYSFTKGCNEEIFVFKG